MIELACRSVSRSSERYPPFAMVVASRINLRFRDRSESDRPAHSRPTRSSFIVKVAPWFAANARTGTPQGGFVAVIDSATGHTRAILADEHYLSDIRTAAAGAIAARLFAPARVGTAAVFGAGVQAYWQSLALFNERRFDRLLVWARDTMKADRLIERLREKLPGVDITVAQSVEEAVRAADVLITATQSREPLVREAWLRPGQHITAVGADDPTKCELDACVLQRALVFVDDRATAEVNGDVFAAIQNGGALARVIDGEIGEVLTKRIDSRTSDKQITVAKLVVLVLRALLRLNLRSRC